jgi:hypothetical protein
MLSRMLTFIIVCLIITACTNEVTSTLTSISTSTSAPSLGAHFPQINTQTGGMSGMDILLRGKLTLDNSCLRVSELEWPSVKGDSFLLIWDLRFSTRTEQGVVQVIDSSTGKVLVSVGDYIEAGGGGTPIEMDLKEPIPDECSEPYWLVGEYIKKIDKP